MTPSETVGHDGWTGSRCSACHTVAFGVVGSCPRCHERSLSTVPLGTDGTIWTVTVQRFAPKSPPYVVPTGGFRPYAVAYVELREGIRVEGVVRCDDPASVRIGDLVRLVAPSPVPTFEVAR